MSSFSIIVAILFSNGHVGLTTEGNYPTHRECVEAGRNRDVPRDVVYVDHYCMNSKLAEQRVK